MKCPKCESSNCKRFEIIHQMGTSTGSVSSEPVTVQTDLAKRCRPPGSFFMSLRIFLCFAVGIIALPSGCMHKTMQGATFPSNAGFGFLYMIISIVIVWILLDLVLRILGVQRRYKNSIEIWEKSVKCLDCGHEYEKSSVSPRCAA